MKSHRRTRSRREFITAGLTGAVALAAGRASAATIDADAVAAIAPSGFTPPSGALKLYNIHTAESLEVRYRRGHAVISSALGDLDYLLRDFRTEQQALIDLDVLDTLSMLYDRFDRRGRFEIISGYRSPRTNAALRRVTSGVAEHSYHMDGRAIDIRLVGTRTDVLRDAALALARGGVGYYADSNFVHVDSGYVRSW